MSDAALQAALAASLVSAEADMVRRHAYIDFPDLQEVALSNDGGSGITIKGRKGAWTAGEVRKANITRAAPRCVCIKMTIGSFSGYTNQSLLHCGVTDSSSFVYNFDQAGHHKCVNQLFGLFVVPLATLAGRCSHLSCALMLLHWSASPQR